MVLLVFGASVLLKRAVTEPAAALLAGVERVAGGDLAVVLPGNASDELGRIAQAFNRMVRERERVEEAVRRVNALLKNLFDTSPLAVVCIDAEGNVDLWNPAAKRTFGWEASEVLGRPLPVIPDGQSGDFRVLWERVVERGEVVVDLDRRRRRKDGTQFDARIALAPRLHDGVPSGIMAIVEDVTERKRAEEAIKQLEQLRAEWNSVVAHDLRQPLNVIGLSAQVLAAKAEGDELRAPIEQIADAAKRLDRMIQDLLDLSRLDARQLTLAGERLDLCALVRSAVDRAVIGVTDRTFSVTTPDQAARVDADPDRLAQVMDNLLSNAVKYGRPSTPIVVEVRAECDRVSVAVTNEGTGIEPEELPLLFQRFQRTGVARRSGVRGIGLGLYIARALLEAHGGGIIADSTPGATTTFRFHLPLVPGFRG
jgi:PAS domain S-box-containing protein